MVVVAQLVRALVCGTRSRRFEPGLPPRIKALLLSKAFFVAQIKDKKNPQLSLGIKFLKYYELIYPPCLR